MSEEQFSRKWIEWTPNLSSFGVNWGIGILKAIDSMDFETNIYYRVEVRIEPILGQNQWVLYKGWTFSEDQIDKAREKYYDCLEKLENAADEGMLHPAASIVDDSLDITDEFRIKVFNEWFSQAKKAHQE